MDDILVFGESKRNTITEWHEYRGRFTKLD